MGDVYEARETFARASRGGQGAGRAPARRRESPRERFQREIERRRARRARRDRARLHRRPGPAHAALLHRNALRRWPGSAGQYRKRTGRWRPSARSGCSRNSALRCTPSTARALIHRDIKPHNVLLWAPGEADEHALLTDFGIARAADDIGHAHRAREHRRDRRRTWLPRSGAAMPPAPPATSTHSACLAHSSCSPATALRRRARRVAPSPLRTARRRSCLRRSTRTSARAIAHALAKAPERSLRRRARRSSSSSAAQEAFNRVRGGDARCFARPRTRPPPRSSPRQFALTDADHRAADGHRAERDHPPAPACRTTGGHGRLGGSRCRRQLRGVQRAAFGLGGEVARRPRQFDKREPVERCAEIVRGDGEALLGLGSRRALFRRARLRA